MRCCKVIALYFGRRHKPPTTGQEMLKHLRFLVEKEEELDPGVDMDTIIVNNDAGFDLGNKLLASMDGKKTKRGRIRVLQRENIGISFGAFSHAFGELREEYDYWFFTEEDVVPKVDGYYLKCMEKLDSDDKLAFVGVCGMSRSRNKMHCNGGIGLSHTKYLGPVFDELKKLPHAGKEGPQVSRWKRTIERHLVEGEVEFTHCFIRRGLKITDVTKGNDLVRHYDSPLVLRREIWKMYK